MEEISDISCIEAKLDQLKNSLITLAADPEDTSKLISDDKKSTSESSQMYSTSDNSETSKSDTAFHGDHHNLLISSDHLKSNKRKSIDSEVRSAKKLKSPVGKSEVGTDDVLDNIKDILNDTCDIAMDTSDNEKTPESEEEDIQIMEEVIVNKPILVSKKQSESEENKILSDRDSLKLKCEALKSKIDFQSLKLEMDDFKSRLSLEITKVSDSSIAKDEDDDIQIMEEVFASKAGSVESKSPEPTATKSEESSQTKPADEIQIMEEVIAPKVDDKSVTADTKPGELTDSKLELDEIQIMEEVVASKVNDKSVTAETKLAEPAEAKHAKSADHKLELDEIQIMEEVIAPKVDAKIDETKLAEPAEAKPADTKLEPSDIKPPELKPLFFTFVNETLGDEELEEEDFSSSDSETVEDGIDTSAVVNSESTSHKIKMDESPANNAETLKESSNKEHESSMDPLIESKDSKTETSKPFANVINSSNIEEYLKLEESDSGIPESDDDDIQFMEAVIITKPEVKPTKNPFINEELGDDVDVDAMYGDIIDIANPLSPKKAISQETSLKMDAVIEYVVANYKQEDTVSLAATCKHCKQNDVTKTKTLENSVRESVAIRDESISLISFESCVEAGWPPCFRVTNISIYDESDHMVPYNVGLIEEGTKVFFSGFLLNLVDDDNKIPVERVGPILSWRRPDWAAHDQTAKLILTTMVDNVEVEYHVPMDLMSPDYMEAVDNYKPVVGAKKESTSAKSSPVNQRPKTRTAAVSSTPLQSRDKRRSTTPFKEYPLAEPQTGKSKDHRKISRLLTTLEGFEGIGKSLSHLIPGYEGSADAVAAFLLFIHERQVIWRNKYDLKYKKENLPLTNNKTLGTKWFTNMYREVDRGTMYFRSNLLKTVLKKSKGLTAGVINLELLTKILYKSIVYRLMNKIETFEGFGNIPEVPDWPKFSAYINKRMGKERIFTAAHQNMGLRRFLETMDWVNKNIESIAVKVAAQAGERSLKGCFKVIHSINNVGPFFAWQILCDLLESRLLGKCTDNQWTVLGPGAKTGLRMIFDHFGNRGELGMTRMLRNLCVTDGPNSGFEALGKSFPALLNQNLSLKNVEHALCEFSKYYKLALGLTGKERQYNEGTSRVAQDKVLRCCVCEENSKTKKKFLCVLCNRCFHLNCLDQNKASPSSESFLCDQCEVNVDLWKKEDFDFDEVDTNDVPGKESNFVYAKKKAPKVPKKKDIECIDLSSDEEEDENSADVEDLTNLYFGIEDGDEDEFKTYGESDDNISNDSDIDEVLPIEIGKVWSQSDKGDNAESSGYSSTAEDESKDALDDPLEVVFIDC